MSTPTNSPDSTPIQPLHNPSLAAQVVVPQAPIGNGTLANQAPGMGAKALLAKKLAKNHNPAFISPTDNLLTPCTQKLSAARKKHFNKPAKPFQPFPLKGNDESSEEEQEVSEQGLVPTENKMEDDGENPF